MTVSLVDGNISIGVSAVSASDVAASIAAAVSAYTLTSSLTGLLAAKQATLSSATGGRIPVLDGTSVRRIDNAGDSILQLSENAGVITFTANGYTKAETQALISNISAALTDASVAGATLRTSGSELKRLAVSGASLTLTQALTGHLLVTSTA